MRERKRVQSDEVRDGVVDVVPDGKPGRGSSRRGRTETPATAADPSGESSVDASAGSAADRAGSGLRSLPVRRPVRRPAARAVGSAGAALSATVGAGARSFAAPRAADGQGASLETRNEVVLVGRVAAPADERTLPSGDLIATWRLVVDRPPGRRVVPEGVRAATVDTLDCVAWGAGARRTARGLAGGDVVAVEGALRRRFWRAGAGAVSRCEVEVATVKRLSRAPAAPRG